MKYLILLFLFVGCTTEFKVGKCYLLSPENKYNSFGNFIFEEGYEVSYTTVGNKLIGDPERIRVTDMLIYTETKCPRFNISEFLKEDYEKMGILDKIQPYLKEK